MFHVMTHNKRIRIIVCPLPSPSPSPTMNSASTAISAPPNTNTATKSSMDTCHCCCVVTKLMRKLLIKSINNNKRRTTTSTRHKSSFQCRYDPLSYSLNFEEQDYYNFSAFSSRFLPIPSSTTASTVSSSTTLHHPLSLDK
ncbi:hypothetical protein PIB30_036817 [Stylosanthes scabra]|uniref:Uncharacterized protein n=1 Tax=Stylosanthes scabra TaxID=79078 RepID=A0ABU6QDW0_9FABA|nr:hypothetical protein [Stylosanthes scabra]